MYIHAHVYSARGRKGVYRVKKEPTRLRRRRSPPIYRDRPSRICSAIARRQSSIFVETNRLCLIIDIFARVAGT